jgi:hypothetical protein
MKSLRQLATGAACAAVVALGAVPAAAQVGDISGVVWPGWIPSDRVLPAIGVDVSFDVAAGGWTYRYTVANQPGAQQDIRRFDLGFPSPSAQLAAPDGWWSAFFAEGAEIPGASFQAESPDSAGETLLPSPAQIPAGSSLTFTIVSPYPPGTARTYVQGFAPVPYLPDDFDDVPVVPDDTTNSQRGWAVGPMRYTDVITDGNRRPAVDGFLGFMNLLETGSVLRSPTPIALKLSVAGETVFPQTFSATLNGTDITALFHPGPADGATLTAYLAVGSSPLVAGKNVLITSIDGLVPGTTRTATDTDRMVFDVQP